MHDYSIRAQFEAACPPADVRRWLDDPKGIAGWWSDRVAGAATAPGDVFHVTFPTTEVVFDLEVTEMSDGLVEWHVPENPPWWKGTTIRFELDSDGEENTRILFSHRGFDADDPIIAAITPAWVRFLDNLVDVAHSGRPNPAVTN